MLSLSILAWANSLGDLSADVAMTKKGFGEMAMTTTVAGPVMNILVGQGLSMLIQILTFDQGPTALLDRKVEFYIFYLEGPRKGQINLLSVLPTILIASAMLVIVNAFINAVTSKFRPGFALGRFAVLLYVVVLLFLVFFSIFWNVGGVPDEESS